MSNSLTVGEKAEAVAKTAIDSNPSFKNVEGKELLQETLAKGLIESHAKGNINLDKMIEIGREKSKEDRGDGRSR